MSPLDIDPYQAHSWQPLCFSDIFIRWEFDTAEDSLGNWKVVVPNLHLEPMCMIPCLLFWQECSAQLSHCCPGKTVLHSTHPAARAAFATLSYYPENNLLDDLANHAVSIISTFRPQVTNMPTPYDHFMNGTGLIPCSKLMRPALRT